MQISEFEEIADDYGFGVTELETIGLVGDEDVEEFAEQIPPGTSAALLAIELVWAKRLASRVRPVGRHRTDGRAHSRPGRERRAGRS